MVTVAFVKKVGVYPFRLPPTQASPRGEVPSEKAERGLGGRGITDYAHTMAPSASFGGTFLPEEGFRLSQLLRRKSGFLH